MDVQTVSLHDSSYPARLREIPAPPAVLYHRGPLPRWDRVVAIVGTRRCTAYGRRIAAQLASDLATQDVLVLSGLAWGIDAAAHAGALAAGGCTAAILAGSPVTGFPASNRPLYERMLAAGMAVISEYPPGKEALRWQFPARNRLIAGIAHAVVVVEAPGRSGALITAADAARGATEVMVVPGPADAPSFEGSHSLLRDGARLVTSAFDVLADLGWSAQDGIRPVATRPVGDLERVYQAIDSEGVSADQLAEHLEASLPELMRELTILELKGLIVSQPGGIYARK